MNESHHNADEFVNNQTQSAPKRTTQFRPWLIIGLVSIVMLIFASNHAWFQEINNENLPVEVKVMAVVMDSAAMSPTVILYDESGKIMLPIWIGTSEAYAIQLELSGEKPPRPLTNDLLKTVMDKLGAKLDKTVVTMVQDQTYYAKLYLQSPDGEIEIDARPSDAIALAMRSKAPIFVNKDVLTKHGISTETKKNTNEKTRKT